MNWRIMAAGTVALTGVAGLFLGGPRTTPAAPAGGVTAVAGQRQAGTANEGDGTFAPEGTEALAPKLLEVDDLGDGWMTTGYPAGADTNRLCPFKALPAYSNDGRDEASFAQGTENVEVRNVVTRYRDGDSVLVLAALGDGLDSCQVWDPEGGTWDEEHTTSAAAVDVSATYTTTGGDVVYVELRWRVVGDLVTSVAVASVGSPQGDLADRLVVRSVEKLDL